jgi:hypothetical protein
VPLDPLNPGAMPQAKVALTAAQTRQLVEFVGDHIGSVWLEALPDAYVRAVLIGADGEAIEERPLFPFA